MKLLCKPTKKSERGKMKVEERSTKMYVTGTHGHTAGETHARIREKKHKWGMKGKRNVN